MGKKKCRICKERPPNRLKSDHHLIPKYIGYIDGKLHENLRRKDKIPMCKECHEWIHFLFTNKELYYEYSDLHVLKEELKSRLIHETLGQFMFLLEEENGTVAPTELEQPPCKRTAESSNLSSAFEERVCSIPVIMSGCQPDETGSIPVIPAP